MCTISKETIIKANQRTISHYNNYRIDSSRPRESSNRSFQEINISIKYRGYTSNRTISTSSIRESFGKAFEKYDKKL